ncbi:MAG: ABC transporter substrate-binding protein [Deltaproteobacteria bacterium]|nr:ABC transporter substrate-binding protein [Deltaproteobacteria bacterium]
MKKLVCSCMLLSILIFKGCTYHSTDTFTILIEFPIDTLDPRYAVSAYSIKACRLIYNGLVKIDRDLNIKNDLAEEIYFYTPTELYVRIKKGVRFHNGEELTSEDVKYTYDSIRDVDRRSPYVGMYKRIVDIKVIDRYSLVFKLDAPHSPFVSDLVMGIVNRNSDRGNILSKYPVGTNAFKIYKYINEEYIILEKANDGINFPKRFLSFKVIRDDNTRLLSLLNRGGDLIQNAAIPVIAAELKDESVNVISAPSILYTYMGINLTDPILKHKDVRKAIAYAIDRQSIIKSKFMGMARPSHSVLVPEHWAYEEDVEKYAYDPEKAKRLLDGAGFYDPDGDGPLKRFTVTYKTSTNKFRIQIAKMICKMLEEVGIGVRLKAYEFGTFFSDIKAGNFQIYTMQWTEPLEPDFYYWIFHSKSIPDERGNANGANRGRYVNQEVDRLLDEGRMELDKEKRKIIYSKIQKIISDELPYISLWHEDNIAIINSKYSNYNIYPNASFEAIFDIVESR